ncbi:MAG: DUF512 domain-containing protein, partial [Eubacteriales bacterium]|nr:DUF512 domain-containing protein [Eubacteriales bacterium]
RSQMSISDRDFIEQLKGKELGDKLFLPPNCVRADETILLDDLYIEDIEKELNIKIELSKDNGAEFIKQFI